MGGDSSTLRMRAYCQILNERAVPMSDVAFWEKLWQTPESVDDVWACMSLEYLRRVKEKAPVNFSSLFTQIAHKVVTSAESRHVLSGDMRWLTNCVRILTRLLSVMHESHGDQLSEHLLWDVPLPGDERKGPVTPSASSSPSVATSSSSDTSSSATASGSVSIAITDASIDPSVTPPPATTGVVVATAAASAPAVAIQAAPMAARLVWALCELLFRPYFTVAPPDVDAVDNGVFVARAWASGIGIAARGSYTEAKYETNRTEVLKCLLVCFSEGVYLPTDQYSPSSNRWLSVMCAHNNPLAPTLFYSLINVITQYQPIGYVPYSHALSSDYREALVDASLQLLLILLDFRHIDPPAPSQSSSTAAAAAPSSQSGNDGVTPAAIAAPSSSSTPAVSVAPPRLDNIYVALSASLHQKSDLKALYDGLTQLLNNQHEADNTYLPGSRKKLYCYEEAFVVIWKLMDDNELFFKYVLHHSDPLRLVTPLLYFLYECKGDPNKTGLMYTCVFILLRLSGERELGVALNRPYANVLPVSLPKSGTFADLLIIVTHKLIVATPDHLDALLNVLLTVLANVSPYTTKLSLLASVKLINLFELFSAPTFVVSNETNHQYVFMLLDVFNNIIQYQYAGNASLVYSIARRAKLFQQLTIAADHTSMYYPIKPLATGGITIGIAPAATGAAPASATPSSSSSFVSVAAGESKAPASEASSVAPSSSSSSSSSSVVEGIQGENGFIATRDWIYQWQSKLPIEPILRLLDFFIPRIDTLCEASVLIDDSKIMELISSTTLVGVLPVPHSIVVRRYIPNAYTNMWFTTYVWGVIFLRHQNYPLMDGAHIRMFTVSQPVPDEYDEFGDPIVPPEDGITGNDGTTGGSGAAPATVAATVDDVSSDVLAATAAAVAEDGHARLHGIAHAGVPSGGGPIV